MISINTNTGSLYVRQAMGLNNRGLASAMEQLSTGKQLNNASDNVAGMAISTGLAAQIKALNQAVRNANDGLSVLATADSSLAQISNMLQRMRDLSSQSVNSTNITQDRDVLDREFQQLKKQFSQASATTQWNGINILNGSVQVGSEWDGQFDFQVGSNPNQTVGVQILNLEQMPAIDVMAGNNLDKTFRFNTGVTLAGWQAATDNPFPSFFSAFMADPLINNSQYGSVYGASISLKINGVEAASVVISSDDLAAIGAWYFDPGNPPPAAQELAKTVMNKLADAFNDPQNNGTSFGQLYDGTYLKAFFDDASNTLKVGYLTNRDGGASIFDTNSDPSLSIVSGPPSLDPRSVGDDNFTVNFAGVDGWAHPYVSPQQRFDLTILDIGNSTSKTAQDQIDRRVTATFSNGRGPAILTVEVKQEDIDAVDGGTLLSQAIARKFKNELDAWNGLYQLTTNITAEKGVLLVDWNDTHSLDFQATMQIGSSLPLATSNLTTSEDASYALANVDNALEKLNLQRAKIGIAMSALHSKTDNLTMQSVKTQEARSRIVDTEYAEATSNFTKRSIIQQAASAMLAQANQNPDVVLQLVRSGPTYYT